MPKPKRKGSSSNQNHVQGRKWLVWGTVPVLFVYKKNLSILCISKLRPITGDHEIHDINSNNLLLLVVFWGTKLVSNWPTPQICLVPKWSCRSSKAALCERILLEGPYQKPAKPSCETCNKGELREKWGVHIFVGGWLFFFHFLVLVVFFRDVLVDPRQFWDPKPPGRPVLRIHGSTVS